MTRETTCDAARSKERAIATYRNPVYPYSSPDPFVLKYRGEYWAYCTEFDPDAGCFGILRSPDLIHWQRVGCAMQPLAGDFDQYWAPEVTYDNGVFYLYYSVGDEEYMGIRVAVAGNPEGPFVDSGRQLTSEQFAIDAHVFLDDNGTRYLFYATDFLEHSRIGTGTVVDRMLDPYTLEGRPRPVTRARYDWQVYDPCRMEKGGIRWHTVEGPFVLKHNGLYYQMFSGGNWRNTSYGVSYAVADRIDVDHEWEQVADGEHTLPVLRTVVGRVVGPGHNSVVRGPDNQQLFCVYHRWVGDRRVMALDRLDWAGDRIVVSGPTTTSQPAPLKPAVLQFASRQDVADLGPRWTGLTGRWRRVSGEARQESDGSLPAQARRIIAAPSFVCEISLRALTDQTKSYGIAIRDINGLAVTWAILPKMRRVRVQSHTGETLFGELLPVEFDPLAYHLLRIEVNGSLISTQLDGWLAQWDGELNFEPHALELSATGQAAFSGFALTHGWEDSFMQEGARLDRIGWESNGAGTWTLVAGSLRQDDPNAQEAWIMKSVPYSSFEAVISFRASEMSPGGSIAFSTDATPAEPAPFATLQRNGADWTLWPNGVATQPMQMPAQFDPTTYVQFRMARADDAVSLWWEDHPLGRINVRGSRHAIALRCHQSTLEIDMVRVTAIEREEV